MSGPAETQVGSANDTPQGHNQAASEVAWKFVLQYYKYMNKEPTKLHCFYTKKSTLTHGTEGEEASPHFGQHEIHQKIMALDLDECKVFVHNVDSQSSAAGGIVINVIGEIQKSSEQAADEWRKFVQTFFLAQQTNGYFVLNDMFRYLREGDAAGNDDEGTQDLLENGDVTAIAAPVSEPAPVAVPPPAEENTAWHDGVKQVNGASHATEEEAPEPASSAQPTETKPDLDAAPIETEPIPVQAQEVRAEEAKVEEPAAAADEKPVETPAASTAAPEPTPAPVADASLAPSASTSAPAAPASQPAPASTSAPTPPAPVKPAEPAGPPKPKTWASLAGSGANKWGTQISSESKGVSSAAAPSSSHPVANGSAGPSSQSAPRPPNANQAPSSSASFDTSSITTGSTFVKGVVETISDEALKSALEQFGPTTEVSIVRAKACAFVEFANAASAKRAVQASHEKGGIIVPGATDSSRRKVYVEEKKEKGQAGRGGRTDPTKQGNEGYQQVKQGGGYQQRGQGEGQRGGRGGAPQRGRGGAVRTTPAAK